MSIWRLFIISGSSSVISIISVVRIVRIDRAAIRRGGTIAGSAAAPPGLCGRELATTAVTAIATIAELRTLRIPFARASLRVLCRSKHSVGRGGAHRRPPRHSMRGDAGRVGGRTKRARTLGSASFARAAAVHVAGIDQGCCCC
jgi:hypothetical protein